MALCAVAQSIGQLIASRVVQAIGGACLISNGNAIVTAVFAPRERGRALGIMGAVVGVGLMSGPVIGGFLVDWLDWRSIFYLRLPIACVGSLLSWRALKDDVSTIPNTRFDMAGAITVLAGLTSLLFAINQGQRLGWTSPVILTASLGGVVLLGLFVLIELRTPSPVVDLKLFRNRLFATAVGSELFYFIAYIFVTFLMPFYLITGLGYSSSQSGLILAVVPLLNAFVAPVAGGLSDRLGSRLLCTTGIALQLVGIGMLATLPTSAHPLEIMIRLAAIGLGAGLFQAPNNSSIMGSVPRDRLGTGSAMIATTRNTGQATGLAVAGAVFTGRQLLYESILTPPSASAALVGGVRDAFWVSAAMSFLAMIISFFRTRHAEQPK
jgi:EmrB/QacA subfamily drug resistance transporter